MTVADDLLMLGIIAIALIFVTLALPDNNSDFAKLLDNPSLFIRRWSRHGPATPGPARCHPCSLTNKRSTHPRACPRCGCTYSPTTFTKGARCPTLATARRQSARNINRRRTR